MATAPRRTRTTSRITIALDESGAIAHEKGELFAINVAAGQTVQKAWLGSGDKTENSGQSLLLRKHFEQNALWQARVAELKAERDHLAEDPIWGMATWMVHEVFRFGRAQADLGAMREAAKMRLQIAMKTAPPAPEPPIEPEPAPIAPQEPEKTANVGAPLVQSPQSVSRQSELRAKLLTKGVKNLPIPVEEDA